ncbi:IPT/TIG domain-containing protein [Hymenobacter sp. BT175]|uniref:IPT/TIG domain-containing protein n=1 Tax=Hymenobacter translucens TaxID=2886507 RepID=UPI001D0EDFA4|nr:IPT/TIG domain-containing protein [Hymenobacter translucens]MCC2544888.1 IPT/TIG domain-containing protein [Hymenobacter translucens]
MKHTYLSTSQFGRGFDQSLTLRYMLPALTARWVVLLLLSLLPLLGRAQAPTISSFSPSSGSAGTLVTISGSNLDQVRGVRFGGGALALFTAQSASSLTVQVPVDAASGALRLTPLSGSAVSSATSFSYLARPRGMYTTLSPAGPFDACQARTLTATATTPAFAMTRSGLSGAAQCVVQQPDGKILLGGTFQSWQFATHYISQNNLTRINVDGTLDTGFSVGSGFDGTVNSIALQADGKILVGGQFAYYNGAAAPNLIRLNADGTVDASFGLGSGFGYTFSRPHEVRGVVVQPDGKVLVCGLFDTFNGQPQGNVVRLNADGSRDGTFAGQMTGLQGINAVVLQDDGKVLIGGGVIENRGDVQNPIYINRLVRFNTNGTEDTAFNPGGNTFYVYSNGHVSNAARVNSLVVQADGKILAGGSFATYTGSARPNLVRLLSTGSADTDFTGSIATEVLLVALQRSGHVLVGRRAGTSESGLVRLDSYGAEVGLNGYTVDYTGTRNPTVTTVAEQPDGKLLIGGSFDAYTNFNTGNPTGHRGLVRVNPDFSLNDSPTTMPGAAFTFSPGNTTTNPLTTTTAGNYSAVASYNGETSPASNTVAIAACPTLSNIDFPASSGPEGTLVTITGNYLNHVQTVRFGTGGRGLFTAQGMYNLSVRVPIDAATGPLTLTTATGYTVVTPNSFTFLPRPFGLGASLTPVGPLDMCAPRALTATAHTPAFGTGTGFNGAVKSVAPYLMSGNLMAGKILVGGDFTSYNGTARNGLMQLTVDGAIDPNFNATGSGINAGPGNTVNSVVPTLDNKILVGGQFISYNGSPRTNLVRLYGDGWASSGEVDNTFNPGTGFNAVVRCLALQANAQILVGGDFTRYNNGPLSNGIVRLNSDATQDAGFVIGVGANSSVYTIAVQNDGKVLVGGMFTTFNGTTANGIVRLNHNGSVDATFNTATGFNAGGVYSIGVQADGKVLVGGNFTTYQGVAASRIIRLNADGSRDATFVPGTGFDATVQSIVLQSDGKAVLGGSFTTYKSVAAGRVIRLNTDGSADAGFVPGSGANGTVVSLALQNNNLILAGGSFTSYNGYAGQNRLVRLAPDGTQNITPTPVSGASFSMSNANGTNPFYPRFAVEHQARATFNGLTANSNIVMVTECVAPTITSFTPTSGETGTVVTITGTTLGDITAVTVNNTAASITARSATSLTFTVAAGTTTGVVQVTNLAGTSTGGTFTVVNPTISNIAPASGPAGTLVVITGTNLDRVRGVRFGTGGLGLFTAQLAGSLTVRVPVDAATGALTLTSMAGNTLTGGTFTYYVRPAGLVATLSPAGPQDACQPRTLTGSAVSPAFGTGSGGNGAVYGLVVQTDGRILAGGTFTTYNSAAQNRLVRLLPDGSRDAAFVTGTGFDNNVNSVAVQADGKVLVGGFFTAYNGTTGLNRLVRLNADGTLDATFGTGTGFNYAVQSMVVQPDGKVLVAGIFTTYQGATVGNFIRLNADGSRDASFVTGSGFTGINVFGPRLALQPDGKLLAGGNFTGYNGTPRNGLVRLNANGSLDATFVTGTGFAGTVNTVAVQADGKVLVGGDFTGYNGTTGLNRLLRLNADGSIDATFATGSGFDAVVWNLIVQPDGKVLAAGDFTGYNGTTSLNRLLRLNADGSRDAAFATGTGFNSTLYTLTAQADGQVLAGGDFTNYNNTPTNRLVRLTPAGALDTSAKPVAGARFTFSPGGSATNPLVTSTAGSYTATASLNGETSAASNAVTLTVCPAPTITSFTPTSGATGTVVSVTGTNLEYASVASVNGTAGTITGTTTATSLTFTVAAGSTTGPVRVTTLGGTAVGGTFTVDPVTITSFTPTSGGSGTVVTLTGTNLLGANGVRINGVAVASYTVNSDTQITFTVAANNTTGAVSVTMPGGSVYSGGVFTVDPVTITSISPTGGGVGTVVVITGTNLTGATAVRINTVLQTGFVVNSPTQITFTVAAGTTTGPVRVTKGGIAYTGSTFTVVPLSISGLSPASGPAGTLVTITGTSLDQIRGVRFGGSGLALFTVQSAGSLTVQVPTDAATGVITLTSFSGAAISSAGSFTYTPRPAGLVAALSPAGPFDACVSRTLTASAVSPGFGTGTGLNGQVHSVVVQPDGKVLVGGDFTTYNGATGQNRLIRLHADGSRDAGFTLGTGFNAAVTAVAVQADGKVLVGGDFTAYNGTTGQNRLIRLHADGTLDASFATGAGFDSDVNSVVVQPDGRILVGGGFSQYNGVSTARLLRLNPDGSRDATFTSTTTSTVNSVAVQADGKVLMGLLYSGFSSPIFRLHANGTYDNSFTSSGFNGSILSVVVQADGKVVVGGNFTQYVNLTQRGISRLSSTGSPETSFATGSGFSNGATSGQAYAIMPQPDGKLVVVGNFTSYNGTPANRLIRLTAAGSPDASLATGSGFDNSTRGLAVLADGSLVVGGDFTTYNGTPANRLSRLSATGGQTDVPTPVSGATFTFSPGNITTNPLVTSTAGTYSVVASLNGETSAASNVVTLTACPPTITALSVPAELPGMPVTLTGTGFMPGSSVSFGGVAAGSVIVNSPTSLTATVPSSMAAGSSAVVVTTSGGSSATAPAFAVLAVYDGGAPDACATAVPPTASLNDGGWHYLLSSTGQVVAAYNYTGPSLGDLAIDVLRANPATAVRREAGMGAYLDRNFHLTASGGRFDGRTVAVRFYGLTAEFARLQAAAPSLTLATLNATQYSGTNEDCALANNAPTGERRVLPAPATAPACASWFAANLDVTDHFSEFYLTGTEGPLPVKLVSFTAEQRGPAVELAWRTASENNSDRFEVERSADGRTFERLGTVAAQGNSSRASDYAFLDGRYPDAISLLYYRLRQVDRDGTFSYSPVRPVRVSARPTAGLLLFPNPTTGAATLTGTEPGTAVTVYDALGRQVLTATTDATGVVELVLPRGLPTGVYVVRVGSKALRLAVE